MPQKKSLQSGRRIAAGSSAMEDANGKTLTFTLHDVGPLKSLKRGEVKDLATRRRVD